jgi:hypothetical protein
MKAHSNNSLTFEELDYAQQASSISAQILSLESAILLLKKGNILKILDKK